MRRSLLSSLLLVLSALAGCQSGRSAPPPTGWVQPTVAGRTPMTFSGLQEGRAAFTRSSDSMTAVLEDASWLRFEGDPSRVQANHRAYFEYGYTTFQVDLRSREHTRPTQETFILEDSSGLRTPGRPIAFEGAPQLVDDRYFTSFTLSFRHVIDAELAWIRLTRQVDGTWVEWQLGAPPAPCPPAGP